MNRRIYLENMSVEDALERWFKALEKEGEPETGEKWVTVQEAVGRVTSSPVFSARHSPHFLAAAMDGVAVRADKTYKARSTAPVVLTEYAEVDTGDFLPEGFDAVIMAEDVVYPQEGKIELNKPAVPWQNVRPVGEDLMKTQMIVPANHRISPYDLGGFLAGGVFEIPVKKTPVIGIIPTGTEIVKADSALRKGDLVEYNSAVFEALVRGWGGKAFTTEIVDDSLSDIRETLKSTLQKADAVIINAGSSAGRSDFTYEAVSELGEVLVHGLNIRPGKPALLGIIEGKPVIGLPGYPVSAILDCELLVKPLVEKYLNISPLERPVSLTEVTQRIPSVAGAREYVRVTLGDVGGKRVATPVSRGAGVITSLIKADGMIEIPDMSEGLEAGEKTEAELFRSESEIRNNIVCIGSHDLTLDLLGSAIGNFLPGARLSSANTGSFGGLMALRSGQAHLAGIHLLDETDGSYNISYVLKYLGEEDFLLMNLAYRSQGLMVPRGNPLSIKGLEDIPERGLRYVNRQKGSGTRILLDYLIRQNKWDANDFTGYDLEEYTHLGVGTAVLSGQADCGMGVYAAARVLDLDFIPLFEERFDLCLRRDFYHSSRFAALNEALSSPEFLNGVESLGGYSLRETGKILIK